MIEFGLNSTYINAKWKGFTTPMKRKNRTETVTLQKKRTDREHFENKLKLT